MTRVQIIKAACKLSAKSFLKLMDHNGVFTEILDQDNVADPNDGNLNVVVEGLGDGQALWSIDGELVD